MTISSRQRDAIDDYVARVVADHPPLTPEQTDVPPKKGKAT